MLTTEQAALTTPPVLVDQDLDQQAASLYRLLKDLLDRLVITDRDVGVVVTGGATNLYAGHDTITSGNASKVVTIGITMPNTNYNVLITFGDGFQEHRMSYSTRTTTTFTVHRSGGTAADIEFSWLVAY